MGADDNIRTVNVIYEAFGRGDLETILDAVSDDVDWAVDTASTVGPWYGPQTGKAGVTAFFKAFGETMEVQEFTPQTFAANETDVLTVVRCRAKVRASGKETDMNLHHYFRFQDGKISYYRGTEDTAQIEAALKT